MPGPIGPPGPQGPPGELSNVIVIPEVNRYVYTLTTDLVLTSPVIIAADQFVDDAGVSSSVFSGLGINCFHNLFINGILQRGNIYSAVPHGLTLHALGGTLYSGTPIALETIQLNVKIY
ncbi:DUF4183 domain-containing protein [Paenibacillus sp. KR2-11]